MSPIPDVLILGGGIAGLSIALEAAAIGISVTLLDRAMPGAASRAAAGMLAPSVEGLSADVKSVALEARDFYPAYLARLYEGSGVEVALDVDGILQLADTDEDLERLAELATGDARILDADELTRLEPAFSGRPGGVLHPKDGSVDNVALMRALDEAVLQEPRIARKRAFASRVSVGNSGVSVVTDDAVHCQAQALVLATGAWAPSLAGLPRTLPVRPVRGQLLRVLHSGVRHVTYGAGGYLVPRAGSLIVGATSEDAGFVSETTAEGRKTLMAIASRAFAELLNAEVMDHWSGLRPMTPDGLPILGRDPNQPRLLYACGFSRNGILLAPWAAARMAELLVGAEDHNRLAPFTVGRFDQTNVTG